MRILLFWVIILLTISCTSTRKQLNKSFNKSFIYDTGYFKTEIPLFSYDTYMNGVLRFLERKKIVVLVKYVRSGADEYPVYKVADSTHLINTYYNISRDSEHIAVFDFYKIKRVDLGNYHFLNKEKDSIEAIIISKYESPLFPLAANPKYTKAIFKKTDQKWVLVDSRFIIFTIYINDKIDNTENGILDGVPRLGFVRPQLYSNWDDSIRKASRVIN